MKRPSARERTGARTDIMRLGIRKLGVKPTGLRCATTRGLRGCVTTTAK
jgi:hypothetical protein